MRDQRAGESESLGSQVKWVGFHSRAPGSRQGTESAEAEAGMSDCPLPASLKPLPSLQGTRGTWGALMQGMVFTSTPWRLKEECELALQFRS